MLSWGKKKFCYLEKIIPLSRENRGNKTYECMALWTNLEKIISYIQKDAEKYENLTRTPFIMLMPYRRKTHSHV